MGHVRTAVLVGTILVATGFLTGCKDATKERSGANAVVQNAMMFTTSLRDTFAKGEMAEDFSQGRGGRPDSRMEMLIVQLHDKVRSTITRKVEDVAKRDKALVALDKCNDYLQSDIIPKFKEGMQSKKPEDAKALVPLMNNLEKLLTELSDILNS